MGIRVLIIEDDPAIVQLVQAFFDRTGIQFSTEATSTLAEAIALLSEKEFNVILLDLNLPDSAGLDTVHSVVTETDKPIVVLTGIDQAELAEQAIASGAHCVLQKSAMTMETIVRAIREAVRSHLAETSAEQRIHLRVNRLCEHLREDVGKIQSAIGILESKRLDVEQMHAIEVLRSSAKRMTGHLRRFSS